MQTIARFCVVLTMSVLIGCGGGGSSTPPPANTSAPTVASLTPSSVPAGSSDTKLIVSGDHFAPGTEITWQGTELPTLFGSSSSLQAVIPANDLASAATVQVGVTSSGGSKSTNLPFTIAPSSPPIITLTSLSPSSASVGSPDTTLTVTGTNFVPGMEITWKGTELPTLFAASTSLQALIPASDLVSAATVQVGIQNPSNGIPNPPTLPFTISNPISSGNMLIGLEVNDLAWDPENQVIYLSLSSTNGANGNSVQVLNPATGNLGITVFAGSEPDLLAVSESSKYLYVALDGSSSLQRFKLPGLTTDINVPFGPASFYGPYLAMDVEPSPTADGTVAFVLGAVGVSPEEEGGVHIYDDSMPRANALCGFIQIGCTGNGGGLYDSIQWSPAADAMYMLNNEDTGFNFYSVPVTDAGFGTVTDYGALAGGFSDALHYDATTKLLYTNDGVVIDPATGTKAGQIEASGLAAPDGKNGLVFYLGQTSSNFGTGTYTLESFDINHLTPISTVDIKNVSGTPTHLIRWGTNGLAFTTTAAYGGSSTGGVYLYSGSFVTTSATPDALPQEGVHRAWSAKRR